MVGGCVVVGWWCRGGGGSNSNQTERRYSLFTPVTEEGLKRGRRRHAAKRNEAAEDLQPAKPARSNEWNTWYHLITIKILQNNNTE